MTPPCRDYPRMLYFRGDRHTWIIVKDEDEEAALGAEWWRQLAEARNRMTGIPSEPPASPADPHPPEPTETLPPKPRRGRPPKDRT